MGSWKDLEPYLVTNLAEYKADNPRSIHFISPQQLKHYDDKVTESEGFDVDHCPGFMPGKIVPVLEYTREWESCQTISEWAAIHYERQLKYNIPLHSVNLLKANFQAVGGMMYYLTFTAVDKLSVQATYRSKVWLKPGPEVFEGVSFTRVPGSEVMLGKVRPRRTITHSTARGFFSYVRYLREKNPLMTFVQARREASRLWKELTSSEKSRFARAANRELRRRVSN